MNKQDWIELFQKELDELNLKFDVKQLEKYYEYMNILLEENKNINLTAITDKKEFITKHFIDSLTILEYIPDNSKLIDVGTGAGFPGIPLNLSNKSIKITLMDSLNKRINFLNKVIVELQLEKIDAIHSRAEDLAKLNEFREKYDIATSRAVASLNVLVEYLLPFVKVGGYCICMKGSNIEEEINNSKKAIEILGGKVEKVVEKTLPNTDIKRNIIIIKKIKPTPNKFPRKAGTPVKEPIV